ncbi:MAG: hypothetical protein HQ512_03335 [Rhodospirillales bacterium]|nr:hypothetical protein [Rhodospirillales bacterium]
MTDTSILFLQNARSASNAFNSSLLDYIATVTQATIGVDEITSSDNPNLSHD